MEMSRMIIMKALFSIFVLFQCLHCIFGSFYPVRARRQESVISNSIDENVECKCVLFYQCDLDGFIITNGEGLFDERMLPEKDHAEANRKRIICDGGKFEGELICCKYKPGEANKPPVITPSPRTSSETSGPSPSSTSSSTSVSPTLRKRRSIHCGKQRPFINVRVYSENDQNTLDGEFPWMAAIYRKNRRSQWEHNKAGSLIHPKVVLTAAHVVGSSQPEDIKVIVNGKAELSQIGEDESNERNVVTILRHGEFSSGTLYNDVALLILEHPYNISASAIINTICLRPEMSYVNKICYVAGWGNLPGQTGGSKWLKKVELPTHNHEKCEEMLRKTRLSPEYTFHESFMCAGGEEGKDACIGDGGSPLVCPSGMNDSMYQVGIVAYGVGCGMKNVPGVYVDVTFMHDWIVESLGQFNITV